MPDTSATGAAISNGQGEATTMTSAKLTGLPEWIQAAIPITREIMVMGQRSGQPFLQTWPVLPAMIRQVKQLSDIQNHSLF